MGQRSINRSRRGQVCLVALLVGAPPATLAATVLTSNAFARFGSGNTTFEESAVSGFPLADDGTTALQQVQNGHLELAAQGRANLPGNAIGVGSAWLGASVVDHPPNGGTVWNLASGAFVRFQDNLSITSPTLAAGTSVQIQFSLHTASSQQAVHSRLPGVSNNQAFAQSFVDAGVSAAGVNLFALDANQHHAITDTTPALVDFARGLLNPATPHLDFLVNAKVGDTLRFSAEATVRTSGNLSPITVGTNPVVLENTTGEALALLALAFGASALTGDVVLLSEHFGNAFPAAALADAAHAATALAVLPIPIPGVMPAWFASLAWLVLARRTRSPVT